MAQRAQERGTPGGKKEQVPRDKRRQEERGKGCGDEDKKVQYEANGRLEASTGRGGVDGGEEQRCTKSTTHVGRANSGTQEAAGCRAPVGGEAAARIRAQTRCHVCSKMSHEPRPSQSPAAEVPPPPRAVRGYGGPGLVRVRVQVARMQADSAPQPPSPTFTEVSSPSSPESPLTVQREGPRAEGQQRKEEAAAGTGQGGDKGGQAEASGGRTEVVAAEAEGQGEGQGQQAVVRRRADSFKVGR